ncbi:MAG: DUF359 domain-containing protein [Candidatus Bathyarchaeia archaeon]
MGRLVLGRGLRPLLQKPLGEVVSGAEEEVAAKIRRIIECVRPPRVVAVGDAVSRLVSRHGLEAGLMIVDNREMRRPVEQYDYRVERIFKVANPPGVIEDATWPVVAEALEGGRSLIVVDGEEDLLALVSAAQSPIGSLILYGQPGEGVVAFTADKKMKAKVASILGMMGRVC